MNNPAKQSAILWLTKNGFFLYNPLLKSVVNLAFPPDTVNYLEIIDENKFSQLIQSFVNQYKLPPFRLYIIVGPDALIEKVLPTNQPNNKNDMEKQVLDNIPFENIYSTKRILGNEKRIVAFNANFYQSFKNVFDKIGWSIETVSPYYVTGQTNFNESLATTLLKNTQPLTQENFIKTAVYGTDSSQNNNQQANQSKKNSLPWLLVIFFGLLGVLVIMLIIRLKQKPPSLPKIQPTISVAPTPSSLPVSTLSATLSPERPTTQSATITIKPSPTPSKYPITITP